MILRRHLRLLLIAALVSGLAAAQAFAGVDTAPRYRVVHGWPVLPAGEVLGAVGGVGVDSKGTVYVFHRAGRSWPKSNVLELTPIERPTVAVFDGRTGKLLRRWGEHAFAMPHGLTVDAHDTLWLTDVALQQVFHYSADGKLLMSLGERGVAGDDAGHFNRPTAVAVASDGSFYVSDGYLNTRVVKYSAEGKFLFQWGTKGSGPGQFDLPHWVALDAAGRVYVADRSNRRLQVFDAQGRYLTEWSGPSIGRPYGVAVDRQGRIYVADGGDQPAVPPDRSAWVLLGGDGNPLARIGRFGNYDGQFEMAHSIAVGGDGAVYVGDITGARVQKFVPLAAGGDARGH